MPRRSEAALEPLLGADESSFEQREERRADGRRQLVDAESWRSFNDAQAHQNAARGLQEREQGTDGNRSFVDFMRGYPDDDRTCLQRLVHKAQAHWNSLRTPNKEEGLDFDTSENKLYSQHVEELNQESATGGILQNVEAVRWLTGLVIAIIVGCLAIIVDVSVEALSGHKFEVMNQKLVHDTHGRAFVYYAGYNILFVSIATAFVAFLDLKAKGSGIPEIKSFLNGRKIHRVISVRTLVSKLAGVIFSVSGSLVLGKEGPMMHAGAVVGAIVSQGRDEFHSLGLGILSFRSDKQKRSFVSIGCACGVAAAFSAPLGGVLFVIEEAASFWSVRLTWLTFFATMACASFVDVVLSGVKDTAEWGLMSQSAVVSFGSFEGASRDPCYPLQPPYRFMQLPIFVIIGALGGLLGAAFNSANLVLSRIRAKYIVDPRVRLVESLAVAFFTSLIFFGLSSMYPCRAKSDVHYAVWSDSGDPIIPTANGTCAQIAMRGNMCTDPDDVNDLETLMLSSLDSAVRRLFHSEALYEVPALLLFGLSVWFLACLTYGTSIPSGLFVPAITIGAALGRVFGQVMWAIDDGTLRDMFGAIDPGTYSLIGGAAMLGGITRMTISIVVILMETTNNSTFAIPLMVTIMSSKVVGDLFTEGLYDMHIELQGIKFVHDEPPPNAHKIRVREVMVKEPIVFNLFERVGDILQVLQSCSHNGFPVVSNITVRSRQVSRQHSETQDGSDAAKTSGDTNAQQQQQQDQRPRRAPHLGHTRRLVSHRSLGSRSDLEAATSFSGSLGFANISPPIGTEPGSTATGSSESNVGAQSSTSEQTSRQGQGSRRGNLKNRKRRGSNRNNLDADEVNEVRGKGIFEGTILRSELLILLFEKVFISEAVPLQDRFKRKGATIAWRDFFKHYPRSPSILDIMRKLSQDDLQRVVDLRPYLNSSALTVHHSVYISRVHQLFRHLGLRHLTVVNTSNHVVGIVTRAQLHSIEHHRTKIIKRFDEDLHEPPLRDGSALVTPTSPDLENQHNLSPFSDANYRSGLTSSLLHEERVENILREMTAEEARAAQAEEEEERQQEREQEQAYAETQAEAKTLYHHHDASDDLESGLASDEAKQGAADAASAQRSADQADSGSDGTGEDSSCVDSEAEPDGLMPPAVRYERSWRTLTTKGKN
ncbi:H+/Cl- exchange transporter 7 [Hondaea fermentalgiana]|uniref:Chloride channel protein n=1 Tax=Hondaea fermentalgiana TaxID=2315210 RepID=A0A2R5H143_9STRA|nr:H+/Cl- exchange transporter 7 [Hondaea fermentalgiana]|eukprot:GBG34501.1 H+/Cl- exchange transporter 7 [Hondaea fermentalgiana]